jgi:hypothetical protein
MGDWKRLAGFGVATVCVVASLFLPWWSNALPYGGSIEVTLRHIEVCMAGTCETGDAGGAYGIISTMTFAWGCCVAVMMISGGVLPALSGEATKARAVIASVIYLGLVPLTSASMPEYAEMLVGGKTIWFWCGVFGPIIGLSTPFFASLGKGKLGEGRTYIPVKRVEPISNPTPTPPPPSDVAPPSRTRAPSRAPRSISLQPDDVLDVSAASAAQQPPPRRGDVRFAVSSAELREDALVAVADGRRREIPWSSLGAMLARELRGGAEPVLMVDLIAPGGPPVRLLGTTELQIGGAAASSDGGDRLRRALAFARAMNPQIELEGATADFLYKKEALPSWDADELARYDARYAR